MRDDGAVGHERGIERHHGVLVPVAIARSRQRRRRSISAVASEHGRRPHRLGSRNVRRVHAVDEDDAMRVEAGERPAPRRCRPRTLDRMRAPATAPPSARLRRSVYFQASMRRCGRPSAAKAPMAALRASRHRQSAARQLRGDSLEGSSESACSEPCVLVDAAVMLVLSWPQALSSRLAPELGVAGLLELQRQLLAAVLRIWPSDHHVHLVGHDVVRAAAGSG